MGDASLSELACQFCGKETLNDLFHKEDCPVNPNKKKKKNVSAVAETYPQSLLDG